MFIGINLVRSDELNELAKISSSCCQANLVDFHIHETRLGILVIMQMKLRASTQIPIPMEFYTAQIREARLLIVKCGGGLQLCVGPK